MNSLVTVRNNYGKIKLKLKQVLDEKRISRNALARSIDVRFEVIDRWYNGKIEKMDLDILARVCFVIGCKVEDIIEYNSDNNDTE